MDEYVVDQPGVIAGDPRDFRGLAGRELFVRVEARGCLQEALPAQHFVDAGQAAGEIIGGVKVSRVGVGGTFPGIRRPPGGC